MVAHLFCIRNSNITRTAILTHLYLLALIFCVWFLINIFPITYFILLAWKIRLGLATLPLSPVWGSAGYADAFASVFNRVIGSGNAFRTLNCTIFFTYRQTHWHPYSFGLLDPEMLSGLWIAQYFWHKVKNIKIKNELFRHYSYFSSHTKNTDAWAVNTN
jgi:hypothetical protein